ncbi:MAG: hypothetical protein Q9169_008459 [Polycauliona sp. 2 TL-2023]
MDHNDGGASQTPAPTSPTPAEGHADTNTTAVQQITRRADMVGISILSTAVIYQYSADMACFIENATDWAYSLLPQSKKEPQFLSTAFFLLMPFWIGLVRAFMGILRWIFRSIENNRVDKAIKICKGKLRDLDVGIANSTEYNMLQLELIELKTRRFGGLNANQDSGKKKKNLKKKKRVSGVKKEEAAGEV